MANNKKGSRGPIVRGAKKWERRVPIGADFSLQPCEVREAFESTNPKAAPGSMLFPVFLKEKKETTVIPAGLAILLIDDHPEVGEVTDNKDGTYDIIAFNPSQLGRVNKVVVVS